MKPSKNKIILIIAFALATSIVFYISRLFYVSIENERSSKIYVQALNDSINRYEFLPLLIAEHYSTQRAFNGESRHIGASNQSLKTIALQTGADAIYLMDLFGNVISSSNYDTENSFLNNNYSFRPYFQDAINKKERQFYYAEGATTGIPGFFISTPVLIDDTLQGVAVVKLELGYWEDSWKNTEDQIIVADTNKIILLTTQEMWRYNSIGNLDENTLSKIKSQQQFPNSEHKNIYTKSISWSLFNSERNYFWFIDRKLYLINRFELPKTQWQFYYLKKHDTIFNSSLIVFLLLSLLFSLIYLLIKGRIHIAESKKRHDLLEVQRKEELQSIINNTHIGIIITNKAGELLSTNHYAKDLLLNEDIIKKGGTPNINELLSIEQKITALEKIHTNEKGSTPNYIETVTKANKTQTIPIMFSIKNISIMSDDVYLFTIVNISKRKAAENELLRINESLEDIIKTRTTELEKAQHKIIQQNKVAALGNLAATIVHELSQPLTAMNSSIGAIRAKIDKEDYNGVIQSANRLEPLNHKMHSVIRLLKSFSYDDEKSNKAVDIEKLINNTLESFSDLFNEYNINIYFSKKDGDAFVKANQTKIDLVFSNIIQNAIDAIEDNEIRKIWVELSTNTESVIINIIDSGKGVAAKNMKQMFSPYFTTKEIGKGLGLGLAICYEIVQEHEGKISAGTTDGHTCFTIELPLAS